MQITRKRRVDAHVDMVPMIDGLLQLFILLMMNMSFVAAAVQLELPKASPDDSQSQSSADSVVVHLDASGQLFLNDSPLGHEELTGRLVALTGSDAKRSVTFRADSSLKYDGIVKTLVAIQQAGLTQIHLAYEEQK
jgi:biopolymer transport protein ExbD